VEAAVASKVSVGPEQAGKAPSHEASSLSIQPISDRILNASDQQLFANSIAAAALADTQVALVFAGQDISVANANRVGDRTNLGPAQFIDETWLELIRQLRVGCPPQQNSHPA